MRRRNVNKRRLQKCSTNPLTGWTRDGYCSYLPSDYGNHLVCGQMTQPFLQYTLSQGNDLITPSNSFPGLKPGDKWCLCANRWKQAYEAGVAPYVDLEGTDEQALQYIPYNILYSYRLRK